jgi:prolyl 4-hydroxylase
MTSLFAIHHFANAQVFNKMRLFLICLELFFALTGAVRAPAALVGRAPPPTTARPVPVQPSYIVEPLSFEHRLFYIHKFLNASECDFIIKLASPRLSRSTVVDGKGGGRVDSVRTSKGMFIRRRKNALVEAISQRAAQITMVPAVHQEDMQVLKYDVGEHYLPHSDWFSDDVNRQEVDGLQRVATILIFLNDDFTGGETIFPALRAPDPPVYSGLSSCAQNQLSVRPKKGDAVLFWDLLADGNVNSGSTHGSCDVVSGVKYSAPMWIRQRPFHPSVYPASVSAGCEDTHASCASWTASGECENNREFMLDACEKSCGMC